MSTLLEGLIRTDSAQVTPELRETIVNNIGCLASMARSVSEAIADSGLPEQDTHNLAYTASLLAELIETLNGCLQPTSS